MSWCELCGPDWCETNEIRVAQVSRIQEDDLMITFHDSHSKQAVSRVKDVILRTHYNLTS